MRSRGPAGGQKTETRETSPGHFGTVTGMTQLIADTEQAAPRLSSWLPAFCTVAVIWGLSYMFIKVAVAQLAPGYIALGRVGLGALTLLLLLAIRRQPLPRGLRLWGRLFVIGLFNSTIPFVLFGYAEQRVSSVLAGIWNGTVPLTTLVVTLLIVRFGKGGHDRPATRQILGLLLGFAGVLVVLGAWHVHGASLVGQLELLVAVGCYGVAINLSGRIMTTANLSALQLSAGQLLTSTLMLLVLAPLLPGPPPALGTLSWQTYGSVAALGVLGTGIAFALNIHVIRTAGVTTGSMVTYVPPLVAALAGVALLHEHLTWNQPVGGVIVLLGVAASQGLLTRRRTGARGSARRDGRPARTPARSGSR